MIPTPFEAWAWTRVMSGQPINGELAAMSEPWRLMAERLATTPLEGRQSGLKWLLLAHPDRDAIIEAMAQVDPSGPAPPVGTPRQRANGPRSASKHYPRCTLFQWTFYPTLSPDLSSRGATRSVALWTSSGFRCWPWPPGPSDDRSAC